MKLYLLVFLALFLFPVVSAVTMEDIVIDLDGSSVNLTGCSWDFSELTWDDGGDWLYVEGLTVSGSKVITYSITENFTTLVGDYSCASFPYPSFSDSKSGHAIDEFTTGMNASLGVIVSFFALIAMVVVLGLVITMFAAGKIDWNQLITMVIILIMTGFICGVGAIIFTALGAL